jgi:hypothetical protein
MNFTKYQVVKRSDFMPFCEKCGKEIKDGDRFCTRCGAQVVSDTFKNHNNCNSNDALQPVYNNSNYAYVSNPTDVNCQKLCIDLLIKKIKTEAVVWIIVASIQIIISIVYIRFGIKIHIGNSSDDIGSTLVISALIMIAIAIINYISAYKNFLHIKAIMSGCYDILEHYVPIRNMVFVLVYNLMFTGLVGAVGAIFGFLTRNFIIKNKVVFDYLKMQKL